MTEVKATEWTARVEETFQALRDADRDAQELACTSIEDAVSAVKLRELFEADRAKLLERAAEITKDIEKGKGEGSFILPGIQPSVEVMEARKVEAVRPKREIVDWRERPNGWEYLLKGETQYRRHFGSPPKHLEKEPEPEEVEPKAKPEKPEAEFEPCLADVRLNLEAPYDIARTFIRLAEGAERKKRYVFVGKVEGEPVKVPTLRRWKGDFKHWNSQCYEDLEEDQIRAQVYDFLDQAVEPNGNRLKPKPKNVNEVIDGLKAGTNLAIADAPCWIGRDGPDAKGLLVCQNGLLELEIGKLWEHDPRLFCLNSVDFDFNPKAGAPRWQRFLGEVWPGDEEAVATLQEFFGLWLTDETKYQKACGLIGRPRSGKGTIGRVLKGLLGSRNYTAVSLQSLGGEFGMEHLIGKKLALVPDVKLDGRMNITLVMERLLTSIGEDEQSINRKNKRFWEGRLGIRWLILGNDVPSFRGTDEAGALATRMVMLEMDQSFLGREDFNLTGKLLAERAGILNWAMEGWRRLRLRDKFVQPASGLELLSKLRASTSTIGMFVTECCELGTEFKVEHGILWAAFCEWSERRRVALTLSTQIFSGALHGVFESVTTGRPRAGMPDGRPLHQCGIKLKEGWRLWRH